MRWIIQLIEKAGSLGVITAAMGCASCFPALGALSASLGLGFLAQYEGVFINTLLPIFAWVALVANVVAFQSHRRWLRLFAGVAGPAMVLLTLYPLWSYAWSTYLFYAGLLLMLIVAIVDLVLPAKRQCSAMNSTEAMS